MARINIPRSEFRVLKDIAQLSETSFAEFLNALVEIEPTVNQIDIAGLLLNRVTSINAADVKAFLRTILSLYQMMDAKQRTAQEIAGDIKETIEHEEPQGFPMAKIGVLAERIQQMLAIGGLIAIAAKAINVMLEQHRIFCGARILSDIRHVFTASAESASAALLVHSLNISFHQGGQHKEFYVALTTNELQTLKKAVERAEKKTESLKALVERSGVTFLSDGE